MTKQHGNICSAWPGKAEGICTKCVRCVSCQNLEHSSHRREKLVGIALVCFEQMGTPANFRQKATPKPTPRVHEAQGAKVLAPAVALAFRQSQVVKKLRKWRKWQSLQCLQLRKFRSQRYLKIRKILWNRMQHDETTWYSYFHNLPLICPKTPPNVPSRGLVLALGENISKQEPGEREEHRREHRCLRPMLNRSCICRCLAVVQICFPWFSWFDDVWD